MLCVNYIFECMVIIELISSANAAKILAMCPSPMISHQIAFRPLTHELAKRGHEVVLITTDPAFPNGERPGNLIEIDVHNISYAIWEELLQDLSQTKRDDNISNMRGSYSKIINIFKQQIEHIEIRNLIMKEQFDLLLIEAWVKPTIALSYFYKVPVIQVSSLGFVDNKYAFGISTQPVVYPAFYDIRLYNLTFWEKINKLYRHLLFEKVHNDHHEDVNKVLKIIFSPDIPSVREMSDNLDMIFLNEHHLWEDNVPVPPGVLFMAETADGDKNEGKLTQVVKSFLDSSVNGVIYISFGSMTQPSLLPQEKMQVLVKVLSQLTYDVLLKWDKDELYGQPQNIRISKWWQQTAILKHPKIKLFITHGGLRSTQEAIYAGVPLIGIPIFGDQFFNTEKYIYHKIGLTLNLKSLTEGQLKETINTVITDDSYSSNILRMRARLNDQPQSALRYAVWAVERALRFGRRGTALLRSPAANMPPDHYYELELALIVILSSLLFLLLTLLVIFIVYKKLAKHIRRS